MSRAQISKKLQFLSKNPAYAPLQRMRDFLNDHESMIYRESFVVMVIGISK